MSAPSPAASPSRSVSAAPGAPGAEAARKTPLRDNVEAFAVAVIMAVLLKYFVLEAYKIPTGSMQPTLMGNAETLIFDRVLVDKLSYHYREPERFEVATFKYPLDRSKNFIKRILGLPGEQLRIAHGDVWTRASEREPWKVLRRPRPVQRETWKPLDASRADETPSWGAGSGAGGAAGNSSWRFGHRSIEAAGEGRARFLGRAGSVMDVYTDGYPRSIQGKVRPGEYSGENAVGDLRVEGEVRAESGCTSVIVELTEGSRRYRLEIPGPAAAADATLRIEILEPAGTLREERGPAWRLPAGSAVLFGAQNLDDELSIDIDGEVRMAIDVELASDQTSSAWIECRGAGASFEDLQVSRDIYYREGSGETQWAIPPGHYFMLGDNTQNSSDSREWTLYVMEAAIEGVTRTLRGNLRMMPPRFDFARQPLADGENPIQMQSERGATTWFRDEWGELFVLPTANCRRLPNEHAPFVPRELITGRALFVFWPYSFEHGILRWKWVH